MRKIFFIFISSLFLSFNNIYSQWFQLNSNSTQQLFDITFFDLNTGVAVGSSGTILRTTNAGTNWSLISTGLTKSIHKLCNVNSSIAYAVGDSGLIMKTINSGANWSIQISGTFRNLRGVSFINSTTGMTVGSNSVILYTTDGGTWLARTATQFAILTGISLINATTAFLSANDMPGAVVYSTTNAGINWTQCYLWTSTAYVSTTLNSIYFIDNNTGFVTSTSIMYNQNYGFVLRTINGGLNWTTVASIGPAGLSGINCIYFFDANNGNAAGNNAVIFHTTNGGLNWSQQSCPVTNYLYGTFFLNALTGYVTGSGGVILKTTNGGLSYIKSIDENVPKEFELFQNYPNPFNPTTKIKFNIPLSRGVPEGRGVLTRLTIYDVLGREVATLVNKQLKPGSYEVEWNASNFSSGVYFYTLKTDNFNQTKKLVLIK